jgi:hypothetical protein
VRSHAGRIINEDHHDIAIGHTPDPLFPATDEQRHYWWAIWQAVGHIQDRQGLPEGTYRLHVDGKRYLGGDETWPWSNEPYAVSSEPFDVVPAEITLEQADDGQFWAHIQAPAEGYRLIDIEGDSQGLNPIRGLLEVTWITETDTITESVQAPPPEQGRTALIPPEGASINEVHVLDEYGNAGTLLIQVR